MKSLISLFLKKGIANIHKLRYSTSVGCFQAHTLDVSKYPNYDCPENCVGDVVVAAVDIRLTMIDR